MFNTYKKFEIAYNFQDDWLNLFLPYKQLINIVFCQSLISDSNNARNGFNLVDEVPKEWNDYKKHILMLKNNGFKLSILFQQHEYDDVQILDKYIDELSIDAIITSCDNMAKYAKSKGIITIASICKLLSYDDILQNDLSMYDEIVLDFPFERGLDAIKKLPNKYKYNMIVNNEACVYNCKFKQLHWKDQSLIDKNVTGCSINAHINKYDFEKAEKTLHNMMLFYPNDLEHFEDYIYNFKIQGREWTSTALFLSFQRIINGTDERTHTIEYFNDAITDGTIKMN